MSYYVHIGGLELDRVSAVNQSNTRDISVYDGVGGGKFPVPQNKGLKEWTIKCELSDQTDIKTLDKMMKNKEPVRLVITSDGYKVSERVLLKSYAPGEDEYAGVFNTTITLIEHVKAGIKTADVPYVAREGKAPALPSVVTLGGGTGGTKTPYDLQKVAADQAAADGEANFDLFLGGYARDENGKIIYNPTTVKEGQPVNVTFADRRGIDDNEQASVAVIAAIDSPRTKFAAKAEAAMDKAWNDFWTWANTPM